MKRHTLSLLGAALVAVLSTVSVANAQLNLVPNGDFSTPAGDSWNLAASGGTVITFETDGGPTGAGDGYGQIDNTAGAWGGVLVAEGGTGPAGAGGDGIALSALGLVAGNSYDIQLDMIELAGSGTTAGIKMESWAAGAIINDSGDQNFNVTGNWDTYTFTGYTVDPAATHIKFVPLLVGDASTVGFDNVGVVVPEPASLALVGAAALAIAAMRRRM